MFGWDTTVGFWALHMGFLEAPLTTFKMPQYINMVFKQYIVM